MAVIGTGIGGLSAAARLAHAGLSVTLFERQAQIGGKMRVVPSAAGPVDTGPTVLTLRAEFDRLFADLGARLSDYVDLVPLPVLARHFWPDGSRLDLFDDIDTSARAIEAFAGRHARRDYLRFRKKTARLFDAFEAPMMQTAVPKPADLTRHVALRPWLVPAMAPMSTLARRLARDFSDARLAQLFGRYATYVGGSPFQSPALLSLISEAEARGVWAPRGGMLALAHGVAQLATELGARIICNAHVDEIMTSNDRVIGLRSGADIFPADAILFNGDPRALALGHLGAAVADEAPLTRTDARSLSANVWAFSATPQGADLAHHNVFFSADPAWEWRSLDAGHWPEDPTIYVCAQDRAEGAPDGPERFELILNAPPLTRRTPEPEDYKTCHRQTFQTLARHGLTFDPPPGPEALTMPQEWEARFPGSDGSLYGQSPHGMMAAFRRPTARAAMKGLYLAGGGAHPGAGVPMATRSGRLAAEAMIADLSSTSMSRPTAMRGGMSTG